MMKTKTVVDVTDYDTIQEAIDAVTFPRSSRLVGTVMFPTGTLGNQLTLQRLTGGTPARVIVHRHSHHFNDAGDNLSQLSGLTMVPLEADGAGYSAAQLKAEISRTSSARVGARIGAVTLESPSRRLNGRRFGPDLPGVIEVARSEGLPLFLDGARMLIECAWTGQTPIEMAAPFDAVYMSLYKYLKAPFGCVIAGSAALFKSIHHDRRRFGGSLYQMWPAAVLAADALPRQADLWASAREVGDACIQTLKASARPPTTYADGTNVLMFDCGASPAALKAAGDAVGLKFLPPSDGRLSVKINETWIGHDPQKIADCLIGALDAADIQP
jgi:threonine aldolase